MLTAMREFIMGSPATPPMRATPGQALPRSATPTRSSKAVPGPKPALDPTLTLASRPRTATPETVQWRELGRTIHETHQHTGQALTLLHDLTTPPPSEKPSQIEELLTALTTILESQRQLEMRQERMEQQLERISNVLRPRAA